MWRWLLDRLFGYEPASDPAAEARESSARARLQELREQELSVGAHLRRGAPVTSAPGQTASDRSGIEVVVAVLTSWSLLLPNRRVAIMFAIFAVLLGGYIAEYTL